MVVWCEWCFVVFYVLIMMNGEVSSVIMVREILLISRISLMMFVRFRFLFLDLWLLGSVGGRLMGFCGGGGGCRICGLGLMCGLVFWLLGIWFLGGVGLKVI